MAHNITNREELIKLKEKEYYNLFPDSIKPTTEVIPASFVLLGDHTHYNEGILLSSIIDLPTSTTLSLNKSDKFNISFSDSDSELDVNLEGDNERIVAELIKVLFSNLKKAGYIESGFNAYVSTSLNLCMGLTFYCSTLQSLLEGVVKIYGTEISSVAKIDILYQSMFDVIGKIANKTYFLNYSTDKTKDFVRTDLRTNEAENLTTTVSEYKFMVFNTQSLIHEIRETCNSRIDECEVGVEGLKLYKWGIKSLRDIESSFLRRHINMIPRRVYNRVFYNVSERERVNMAIRYVFSGETEELGKLINESHEALEDLYDLRYKETNFLQSSLRKMAGVAGTKFISCSPVKAVYAIVEEEKANSVAESISKLYKEKYNKDISIFTADFI